MTGLRVRPVPGRATRTASAAVVCSLVVVLAVAQLGVGPLGTMGAVAGSLLLAGGLVAGLGAAVVTGAAVQLVVASLALGTSDGDGVRPVALVVALLLWASVELACTSLDRRPDSVPTTAVRIGRAGDLLVVAVAGVAIGGAALLAPGVELRLPADARLAALVVTVAVFVGVWWLSRPRRPGGRGRRGPAAPD